MQGGGEGRALSESLWVRPLYLRITELGKADPTISEGYLQLLGLSHCYLYLLISQMRKPIRMKGIS